MRRGETSRPTLSTLRARGGVFGSPILEDDEDGVMFEEGEASEDQDEEESTEEFETTRT